MAKVRPPAAPGKGAARTPADAVAVPRRAGSVEFHKGRWRARVRLADGRRAWVNLPADLPASAEARARAMATALAETARVTGAVQLPKDARPRRGKAGAGETAADWFARWLDGREARGLASVRTDRGRVETHLLPVLGALPMAVVGKRDVERVVAALDAKVRAGALQWKTAENTWMLVSRAFKDACAAKDPTLRVREDNPALGVAAPDRGARKAKQYLYPSEFLALVRCARVPLDARRLYALAVYLFPRAGELEALECTDVALAHGQVHIHQAVDHDHGTVKATKTGTPRRFAMEPAVLPLVRAMHAARGGAGRLVASYPAQPDQAADLRLHLQWAGVARAELFITDATRKNLTFHDLRATGITWMAVRGDDPLKIKRRAGHSSFSITEQYIREAEAVGAGFGEVFPPLPSELVGPVPPESPGGPGGGQIGADSRDPGPPGGAKAYGKAPPAPTLPGSTPASGTVSRMIVIDKARDWGALLNRRFGPSAHLLSDRPGEAGARELRAFAARVGLGEHRPHHAGEYNEHHDVAGGWLDAALQAGAVEIDRYELVAILKAKRAWHAARR